MLTLPNIHSKIEESARGTTQPHNLTLTAFGRINTLSCFPCRHKERKLEGVFLCALSHGRRLRQTTDRPKAKTPRTTFGTEENSLSCTQKRFLPIPKRQGRAFGPRHGRLILQAGFSWQHIAENGRARFLFNLLPSFESVSYGGPCRDNGPRVSLK
jgi:hypothetical protein